ncbi:unnamed protein product [Sphagnum troendelagicum]|uniref:Ubiquinol-cytochrome c chaperone domain-containing protein n=1 Tax=Sphagnum troendelagicum TaxID=128251 RepID=A0ABP0UFX0_9BRYO
MRGASHLTPVWRSLHRRRMTLNAGLSSCSLRPLQEGLNLGWRTEEDDDDARDLHAVSFWRQIHMGRREEIRYVASESKISVAILPTHSTCLNCSPKNVARISTSADFSLSNAATLQEPKLETRPEYEPTERKSPSRVMKPRSLSLDPTSKFRVQDPSPTGFGGAMLKLLGYYSKQSQLIRGANTLYSRISMQVDKPELYANFILEQNFRTTHSMLVLYLWLCLYRVRAEGKDGAAVGQSLYDAFNHDLEKRIIATGLKVLLSKWMKELEKNFYGAVTAYDAAMKPDAAQDELSRALWRNVFAEDDSLMPTGPTAAPVHALARYVRREIACLSLTDSESFMEGNLLFSSDFEPIAE